MPEEITAPQAPPTDGAAPSAPESQDNDEQRPDGSAWFRETALGLTTRPLEAAPRKQQWDEANAELRRGRRDKPEETPKEGEPKEPRERTPEQEQAEGQDQQSSSRETDDERFRRAVQAEVDRRETARQQRERRVRETELRRTNPQEYAKLKEQEEQQTVQNAGLINALQSMREQFDDAAIKPLMDMLPDAARNKVLEDAGHGIEQRRTIVKRGLDALKKATYDEGYAKGKADAQKSLRRSTSFRKELLTELRGEEDEPELAVSNGRTTDSGWDMNSWMRQATGRAASRSASSEE